MDNTVEQTGNTVTEQEVNGTQESVATNATETQAVETQNAGTDSGTQTETNTTEQDTEQGASQDVQTLDFEKLKYPEGVSVNDADKANLKGVLDRIGIADQGNAQSFVDWVVETSKKYVEENKAQEEASAKEWETVKQGWEKSLKSDADFGKDYATNLKRANDAIAKFGGDELIRWLKESDLGGNPALLKTFARIGREFEDAKLVSGSASRPSPERKTDVYGRPMFTYKDS